MAKYKIYIDRIKLKHNEPAIMVEFSDGTVEACSSVIHSDFSVRQDFTRQVKPVVWIETDSDLILSTKRPPT